MADLDSVSTLRPHKPADPAHPEAESGVDEEDAAAFEKARKRALEPSRETLTKLERARSEAQTQYDSDTARLAELQKRLAAHERGSPAARGGRLAGQWAAAQLRLENEAEALRKQIDADKGRLDTAESDYRVALAAQSDPLEVQAAAISYKPAGPTALASAPVTRALDPILGKQLGAAEAAQGEVRRIAAEMQQISGELAALRAGAAGAPGRDARIGQLEQQLAQQQTQLKAGLQAFHNADADVAAATVAAYSQQVPADREAVNAAAAKLRELHATLDVYGNPIAIDASGKPTDASLTPEQQVAYGRLWAALSKYNTDLAVIAQAQARLELYASDKAKYGTAASDAVTKINQILSRIRITDEAGREGWLKLNPVKAVDPQTAQAALEKATQALTYATAEWNSARAFGAYSEALLRIKNPGGEKEREQAGLDLARAKANYDQASSYLAKLAAQQGLAVAQAKNNAERTAANALALEQAREQLAFADANLLAATAAVHLMDLHDKVKDLPPDQQRAQLQPAELTLNNLRASANLLGANLVVARLEAASQQAPEAERGRLQQLVASARLQQLAAQYQLRASEFALTVPAHLLSARTPQDQAALREAYTTFFNEHPGALSDPQVAAQLLGLQPGEKVDVQKGIDEIRGFLDQTERDLANHTVLQNMADFFGGLFGGSRSEIERTLKENLTALQALKARKDSMGPADFNRAYLGIMGNLSTHFYVQSLAESRSAENWSAAQEVVRAVLATGAAIGVGAAIVASGGTLGIAMLAGGAVGFVTSEGIDAAQNVTTLHSGGDLSTNRHIGLLTPMTNNFFYGGVTGDEWARAGVNAAGNALTSTASAAGFGIGRLASQYVMTSTMPAILTRLGVEGLQVAPAGAEPGSQAVIAALNAQSVSAPIRFAINAVPGSAGVTTMQGFMGAGQVAANELDIRYEQAAGRITPGQAQEQRERALGSAAAGLVMGPFVGFLSAAFPNTFWGQLGGNTVANTAFAVGEASLAGRPLDANDALNGALNTLAAMGIHAGNRFFNSPGAVAGERYNRMAAYAALYEQLGRPPEFPAPDELSRGGVSHAWAPEAGNREGGAGTGTPPALRSIGNWALIAGGSAGLEAAGFIPQVSEVMDASHPSMAGSTANELSFTARGGLLYARIWYENLMRDTARALKEGTVSGDRLDWLISHITEAAGYKGFSKEQLLRVTGATEEFRAGYDALSTAPEAERTAQRRALAQEYWRTLSRIFGVDVEHGKELDAVSFSPFDPRAPQGIALRAGILATYAANVVVASQSGLLPTWADAGNIPAYLSKIGFFAGNTGGWALTARALIEGMNGRAVEGNPDHKLYNKLARINSWIFTGAGLAWATGDGFKLVNDILANHPIQSAEDAAGVAIKLAYTYAQYKLSRSATAKARGEPGLDPNQQQRTIYVLAAALALSQGLHAVLNWDRLAQKLRAGRDSQGNKQPSLSEMLKEVETAMERDAKAGPAHAPGPIAVIGLGFTSAAHAAGHAVRGDIPARRPSPGSPR